ncbi:MAG: hypothetical protein IJ287_03220 [Methanobrevibacter sp.]|nr:hypothetical protein [Methanobrevibacter sp.]MBR1748890.1 hypothetical protein [Bacilli bacterium]
MKKDKIIELVHNGYMETEVTVYTNSHKFTGEWFAVDLSTHTISIEANFSEELIIDINSIVAMEVIKNEAEAEL